MTSKSAAKTAKTPAKKGAANQQARLTQLLANHWAAMTGAQKMAYERLAQAINNFAQTGMQSFSNGYSCFLSVSTTLMQCGNQPNPVAPTYPPVLAPPPALTLEATIDSTGTLAMNLHAEPEAAGQFLLYGTRAISGARVISDGATYKFLGMLNFLPGTLDVSALYLAKYRVKGTGYTVGLKLIAVTDGLRAKPVYVETETVAAPAAASEPLDKAA